MSIETQSPVIPKSFFIAPDWADPVESDADLEPEGGGEVMATWISSPRRATDDGTYSAEVRRFDYFDPNVGFRNGTPEIQLWIGGNNPDQMLTSEHARKLAGAMLLAADDLDRINAREAGHQLFETPQYRVRDKMADGNDLFVIVETTEANGTKTISADSVNFEPQKARLGDKWDSNTAEPRKYHRYPPEFSYECVGLARRISPTMFVSIEESN